MQQVSNGIITVETSNETCQACPLLQEAIKYGKPLFVNLSTGALKELLQCYRHAEYEIEAIYLPEIEWAMKGPFCEKDFQVVVLRVGGREFRISRSLLEKIPYFQAVGKFSGESSFIFDRDSDVFAAYLDAKRNPNLVSPLAKLESVYWLDAQEKPIDSKRLCEPVHHAKQGTSFGLTDSPQITLFKSIYRRHTPLFRRVHQRTWETNEISFPLTKEMGCLARVYLRDCPMENIQEAKLSFENDVEFVHDRSVIELENANIQQKNGIVLFANLGFSWPMVCHEGVLTIKLHSKQHCSTAVVCVTMEDPDEVNRFRESPHPWLCYLWSGYRAQELTLPEGAIIAVFVKGTSNGGIYRKSKLISLLDETIDVNLPDDWHMIQFSTMPILQVEKELQQCKQPGGHLASDGKYVLRLDQECEIKIYEYAIYQSFAGGRGPGVWRMEIAKPVPRVLFPPFNQVAFSAELPQEQNIDP